MNGKMNIYVGNLSPSTGEDSIRQLFEQYGEVTSVKIIKDKFTNEPRGFAFVEMPSSDEANEAINETNGKELNGQSLKVNEARPPKPHTARRSFGNGNGGGSMDRRGGNGGGSRGGNGGGFGGRNRY